MKANRVHLWAILGAALLIRLLALGTYPLMDTTEARYGEMARLMVETGNWITPQFDYGIPFWGKPPLFTWMSALGIELFGINEFAVRVPHWLAGVLVIVLMAYFSRRVGFSGLLTSLVLATCAIFSVATGAVMTDMALTMGMTLAMVGFYLCWRGSKSWGYVGFIGLAIGLLSKGPLIVVLMGIAVVPWLMIQHGPLAAFNVLWRRFPILGGSTLMLLIALPWYFMAEVATPGFLNYFIIGEHVNRFLVSGWEGDLYGSAHDEMRGTIWLFWLCSAAPWSIVLPILLWFKRKSLFQLTVDQGLLSFLFCWMLSPLLLFTFSGNILPAYVLPGVPAIGLLISILLSESNDNKLWIKCTAGMLPMLLIGAVAFIQLGMGDKKSDKGIFRYVDADVKTYYVGHRPFSGQFYSAGQAIQLKDKSALDELQKVQLIGRKKDVDKLVEEKKLTCVIEYTANSKRSLYRCQTPS